MKREEIKSRKWDACYQRQKINAREAPLLVYPSIKQIWRVCGRISVQLADSEGAAIDIIDSATSFFQRQLYAFFVWPRGAPGDFDFWVPPHYVS